MSLENVKTVQEIYAAFGSGDVAAIVARVTDDTQWTFNGGRPDKVAYHTPYRGKEALPRFFQDIASTVDFTHFEPREFIDNGPHVIVEMRIAFVNRTTGRTVDQSQIQWWTFDANGKVSRLVHYEDTAQTVAAAA